MLRNSVKKKGHKNSSIAKREYTEAVKKCKVFVERDKKLIEYKKYIKIYKIKI